MRKRYSIYSVFGTLFVIVISFLTIVVLVTYYMKSQEYKLILDGDKSQLDQESEALIKLTGNTMSQVAWDYTYWDELVLSVESKDPEWFEHNITTIITSFRMDYVAVYNKSYNLIHEASSPSASASSLIPESIFDLFKERSLLSFFIKTDKGLFRVFGATIHPTSDPLHNQTPASGYLFVSKKWDDDFLNELSTLTGSSVILRDTIKDKQDSGKYSIISIQELIGSQGRPEAWIEFTRESSVLKRYRESTFNIVLLLSVSLLVTIGLYMFAVMRWGINPLKRLIRYIEKEDSEGMRNLKSASTEYSKVGMLLADHFSQKEELMNAKRMAEESDRLKSAFLANVSHEIRTPMNGIMGFAALLSEPGLTEEERKEYIQIIEESGNRMLSIINDLINISIIDAGQIKLNLSQFKINELISHVYDFFKLEIEGKAIKFKCNKGLDDDSVILSDRDKLYAILVNLLKNASKYTHSGTIEFGYSLVDKSLKFYVSDTGIGIPKDRQEAVFGRFIQADENISKYYEGTGLGLSITKAYIEELNGDIWLESEPNKGSTFFFTLPLNL